MSDNPEKLENIKQQADAMGVKYHHRAGIEKIQFAINSHISKQENVEPEESLEILPAEGLGLRKFTGKEFMTEAQYQEKQFNEIRRNAGRLVRCRIQNMNPNKKEYEGEIFSVGSAKIGTHKKFVPFNTGEPYHLPQIIFDALKEKKCSVFFNAVGRNGQKTRKSRLINEFILETLTPLTQGEIKELARRQAMAAGAEV